MFIAAFRFWVFVLKAVLAANDENAQLMNTEMTLAVTSAGITCATAEHCLIYDLVTINNRIDGFGLSGFISCRYFSTPDDIQCRNF